MAIKTINIQPKLIDIINKEMESQSALCINTGQINPTLVAPAIKKEYPGYRIEIKNDNSKQGGLIYIYKK